MVIALVLGWLVLSGGSIPSLSILWKELPGTRGLVTIANAVMLGLILIIVNFVLRMPREGGPLEGDEADLAARNLDVREDSYGRTAEEIQARDEFAETGSPGVRVTDDDRPVEDPS
ncbi:hypothetical protein [Tautonia rosea]|uniref:hypothetical protein n=1 Tax=Tautonia rosea TaxID=2728037 RepID=UPI0014746EA6|nr:hypothetical protein [Tautonia rosea]